MPNKKLTDEILELKKEKDAYILAHYYQDINIQLIADCVGDSLELSKRAKSCDNKTIVFCGVHFMAESAKLLSPEKTVLLPNISAGCPMADRVTAETVRDLKKQYPSAATVCYVNSSAAVKAEVDICCTSANAVNVVKSLDNDEIIFIPDKNLGSYAAGFLPEKKFIFIDGCCPVHDKITVADVKAAKAAHPEAKFAVHPECPPAVVAEADFVGSTSAILNFCEKDDCGEFIIGTESGIIDRLNYYVPGKKYYPLTERFICEDMKKTTLEDVRNALLYNRNEIVLSEETIIKASKSVERMILV